VENCVFCQIISGKNSAHRVFEDELCMAFLDVRPLFFGHTLVVPKTHIETLTQLPHSLVGDFFSRVQRLTAAVERAMQARGSFVAMNNTVSQSVPHLHVHIVPRNPRDGLRGFFWPRTKYPNAEEAERVASVIREHLKVSMTD